MTIPHDENGPAEIVKMFGKNPFDVPPPEQEPDYRPIVIDKKVFGVCRRCSAVVTNPVRHDDFHRRIPENPCV